MKNCPSTSEIVQLYKDMLPILSYRKDARGTLECNHSFLSVNGSKFSLSDRSYDWNFPNLNSVLIPFKYKSIKQKNQEAESGRQGKTSKQASKQTAGSEKRPHAAKPGGRRKDFQGFGKPPEIKCIPSLGWWTVYYY